MPCFWESCPEVYLEAAFDSTPFRPRDRLPVAKELGETSLMLLCHPTPTNDEIEKTCHVLREVAFGCAHSMFTQSTYRYLFRHGSTPAAEINGIHSRKRLSVIADTSAGLAYRYRFQPRHCPIGFLFALSE